MRDSTQKIQRLTVSAVMLALATVLALVCEMIPFLNLPFGGGFTVASMLPIVIVSYMYGVKWGFFTSGVYAVIQVLMSLIMGKTVLALFTPTSDDYMGLWAAIAIIIIDYILAYTALGIGGIFRNVIKSKTLALVLGVVLALGIRYVCHIVSGYIFYGAWASWFFEDTVMAELAVSKWIMSTFTGGGLSFIYSLVYNGCYMIPEIVITAICAFPISKIKEVKKINI